jgi:hypothetical protein
MSHSSAASRRLMLSVWSCLVSLGVAPIGTAAEFPTQRTFSARDSLVIGEESKPDARACLDGLAWEPAEFEVSTEPVAGGKGDLFVRFPTPVPSGEAATDLVTMEWYISRDEQGRARRAPAVVVVHESGKGMEVGRIIARDFPRHGLHSFLVYLPHYGTRKSEQGRPTGARIVTALRQAVADVRRARDAVAVLPEVIPDQIFLQGTSLGGIVSATVTGLDHGYDGYFLMLAGGDLYDVIMTGDRDAAKFRAELSAGGLEGEPLRQMARTIEPNRIAHRADPDRVWLYTANYDTVIPPRNSDRLAQALGIDDAHRVRMPADHYSGIIYLPFIMRHMVERMAETTAPREPESSSSGLP